MRGVSPRALTRHAGLDRDRVLQVVVLAGLVGAVVLVLFGGVLPLGWVASPLYLVALSLPFAGAVLALAAVALLAVLNDRELPALVSSNASGSTAKTVGAELSAALDRAYHRRYAGTSGDDAERIHGLLTDAAVRATRRHDSLNETGAQEAVRDGSWTDDPVASGFCSPDCTLPLAERLRGVVDPGGAYRRRVDRTLDAIDRLGASDGGPETTADDPDPDPDGDIGTSQTADDRDGTGTRDSGTLTETVFDGRLGQEAREQTDTAWGGLLALLLAGVGLALGRPILVVAATVSLWFVAAGVLSAPTGVSLEITRRVSTGSGDPGDRVTVETTVRNTGEEPVVDLRVADGTPGQLPVRSGASRACVSLAPGETTQLGYELELRRGTFSFGPVTVRRTHLLGGEGEQLEVGGESEQTLRCLPAVDQVPLGGTTGGHAGDVPANEGGRGVEFHSVREYEAGDPVSSIDWRRYAHTRKLATVEFRVERATRVVCLVDCRQTERRDVAETQLPARALSIAAARRTAGALLEAGHPTGLATMGSYEIHRVEPSTDPETRAAIDELLDAQLDGDEPRSGRIRSHSVHTPLERVSTMLSGRTQVFLFSSLIDDSAVDLAARLQSRGVAVTVVSPDVTAAVDDTAVRLAGLKRDKRVSRARVCGARVIDWNVGRPLAGVLDRAMRGVSAT